MIKQGINDIDKRLARDEWYYLAEKYPQVAFNHRWGSRYFWPQDGYRHLLCAEPYIELPENWDFNIIRQYDTYITFSRKMYERHKHEMNIKLMRGCVGCNGYYELDNFLSYDEKKKGVLFLNKLGGTGREGDIYYMRKKVLDELRIEPMVKHVFAREPWGGDHYQGSLPFYHSHYENLKKINEYLFCVCFESTYHPFWSYDFITERMFNCFKSKTVPIYFGCYNIEDWVPSNLYIDYREFNFDNTKLSEYLLNFPKQKYVEMTEAAYEWNKTNRIGNIQDLEEILCGLK
jgi:hypothetical protein